MVTNIILDPEMFNEYLCIKNIWLRLRFKRDNFRVYLQEADEMHCMSEAVQVEIVNRLIKGAQK